jgi:hypothetical protein
VTWKPHNPATLDLSGEKVFVEADRPSRSSNGWVPPTTPSCWS